MSERIPIPRNPQDDYSAAALQRRREFLEEQTGASLEHLPRLSFDPGLTAGRCSSEAPVCSSRNLRRRRIAAAE